MTKWVWNILRIYNLISWLTRMTPSLGLGLHPGLPLSLREIPHISSISPQNILCQITHGVSFLELFIILIFIEAIWHLTLNKTLRWHAKNEKSNSLNVVRTKYIKAIFVLSFENMFQSEIYLQDWNSLQGRGLSVRYLGVICVKYFTRACNVSHKNKTKTNLLACWAEDSSFLSV